ncbi:hypothetical protein SK128_012565 [Halocaridina rubra]|uniref:Uncharacterized protein n=1 Tax=Halocaridina rubra TaxID=373956 RepID=A0AAN8WJ94_HALRR
MLTAERWLLLPLLGYCIIFPSFWALSFFGDYATSPTAVIPSSSLELQSGKGRTSPSYGLEADRVPQFSYAPVSL